MRKQLEDFKKAFEVKNDKWCLTNDKYCNIVKACHNSGNILPNDFYYSMIVDCINALVEARAYDVDIKDDIHCVLSFTEQHVYNSEINDFLKDCPDALYRINEAISQGSSDLFACLVHATNELKIHMINSIVEGLEELDEDEV